jgi:hypothetical protein
MQRGGPVKKHLPSIAQCLVATVCLAKRGSEATGEAVSIEFRPFNLRLICNQLGPAVPTVRILSQPPGIEAVDVWRPPPSPTQTKRRMGRLSRYGAFDYMVISWVRDPW